MKKRIIYILVLFIIIGSIIGYFGIKKLDAFSTLNQSYVDFSKRTDLLYLDKKTYVGKKLKTTCATHGKYFDGWTGQKLAGDECYTWPNDFANVWCMHYKIPADDVTKVKENYDMLITSVIDMNYTNNGTFYVEQYCYNGQTYKYTDSKQLAAFSRLVATINADKWGYYKNITGAYILAHECNLNPESTLRGLSTTNNEIETETGVHTEFYKSIKDYNAVTAANNTSKTVDRAEEEVYSKVLTSNSMSVKIAQSGYIQSTGKPYSDTEVSYQIFGADGKVKQEGKLGETNSKVSWTNSTGELKFTLNNYNSLIDGRLVVKFTRKVDVARLFIVENSFYQHRSVPVAGKKDFTKTLEFRLVGAPKLDINGKITKLVADRKIEYGTKKNTTVRIEEDVDYEFPYVNAEKGDKVLWTFNIDRRKYNRVLCLYGFDVWKDSTLACSDSFYYVDEDGKRYNGINDIQSNRKNNVAFSEDEMIELGVPAWNYLDGTNTKYPNCDLYRSIFYWLEKVDGSERMWKNSEKIAGIILGSEFKDVYFNGTFMPISDTYNPPSLSDLCTSTYNRHIANIIGTTEGHRCEILNGDKVDVVTSKILRFAIRLIGCKSEFEIKNINGKSIKKWHKIENSEEKCPVVKAKDVVKCELNLINNAGDGSKGINEIEDDLSEEEDFKFIINKGCSNIYRIDFTNSLDGTELAFSKINGTTLGDKEGDISINKGATVIGNLHYKKENDKLLRCYLEYYDKNCLSLNAREILNFEYIVPENAVGPKLITNKITINNVYNRNGKKFSVSSTDSVKLYIDNSDSVGHATIKKELVDISGVDTIEYDGTNKAIIPPTAAGRTLEYVLTVTNDGDKDLENVLVEDIFPEDKLSFESASFGTQSGNKVSYTIPSLPIGDDFRINLKFTIQNTVTADETIIKNEASLPAFDERVTHESIVKAISGPTIEKKVVEVKDKNGNTCEKQGDSNNPLITNGLSTLVEKGDIVKYEVKISNNTGKEIKEFNLNENIPKGLKLYRVYTQKSNETIDKEIVKATDVDGKEVRHIDYSNSIAKKDSDGKLIFNGDNVGTEEKLNVILSGDTSETIYENATEIMVNIHMKKSIMNNSSTSIFFEYRVDTSNKTGKIIINKATLTKYTLNITSTGTGANYVSEYNCSKNAFAIIEIKGPVATIEKTVTTPETPVGSAMPSVSKDTMITYNIKIENPTSGAISEVLFTEDNGKMNSNNNPLSYDSIESGNATKTGDCEFKVNSIDGKNSVNVSLKYKVVAEEPPSDEIITNTVKLTEYLNRNGVKCNPNKEAQAQVIYGELGEIPLAKIEKEVYKVLDEGGNEQEDKTKVKTGYKIMYKVTVKNENDEPVTDPKITDVGSSENTPNTGDLQFEKVQRLNGTNLTDLEGGQEQTISCTLNKGDSVALIYTFKVNGTVAENTTRTITNKAKLISPNEMEATADVTIYGEIPEAEIKKEVVGSSTVKTGDVVKYNVTITNKGNVPINEPIIKEFGSISDSTVDSREDDLEFKYLTYGGSHKQYSTFKLEGVTLNTNESVSVEYLYEVKGEVEQNQTRKIINKVQLLLSSSDTTGPEATATIDIVNPDEEIDVEFTKKIVTAANDSATEITGVPEVNNGDTVIYKVTVNNKSSIPLTNVCITEDDGGGYLTYSSVSGGTLDGDKVSIGTLTAGTSKSLYYTYIVNKDEEGEITNTATLTYDGGSKTDSKKIKVKKIREISINKSVYKVNGSTTFDTDDDDVPLVSCGDLVTYRIVLTNNGDVDIKEIKFTDKLFTDTSKGLIFKNINGAEAKDSSVQYTTYNGNLTSISGEENQYYRLEYKVIDGKGILDVGYIGKAGDMTDIPEAKLTKGKSKIIYLDFYVESQDLDTLKTHPTITNTAEVTWFDTRGGEAITYTEGNGPSSSATIKLKRAGAEIEKSVYKVYKQDGTTEYNKEQSCSFTDVNGHSVTKTCKVAQKDYYVEYKIKVKNTGGYSSSEISSADSKKVSNLNKFHFTDNIPDELELVSIDGNTVQTNKTTFTYFDTTNGSFGYQYNTSSKKIDCKITEDIAFEENSSEFTFRFKVITDNYNITVTNIASLYEIGRKTILWEFEKKDAEYIYIKEGTAGADIDKKVTKVRGGIPTGNPPIVNPGDAVEYTVTITNTGSRDLTNVTISDDSASGSLDLVSVSTSYSVTGTTVTVPTFTAGSTITIIYSYTVGGVAPETNIINTATLKYTTDTGTVTKTDTAKVRTDSVGSGSITKTVNAVYKNGDTSTNYVSQKYGGYTLVESGDTVKYKVSVTNDGTKDITGMVISEQIPSGLTYLSASGSGYSLSTSTGGGYVTCTLSSISGFTAGTTKDIYFTYRVNTVSASSSLSMPLISNTAYIDEISTEDNSVEPSPRPFSTATIKHKRIGADILKTINFVKDSASYSSNGADVNETDGGIRLVECGDYVQYNIRIRNTGGFTGTSIPTDSPQRASEIYSTTFTETMPSGLTLYKINGQVVTGRTSGTADGVSYTITNSGSENKVVCTLTNSLSLGGVKNVTFDYIVDTFTSAQLVGKVITNTATLNSVTNRSNKTYTDITQTSQAKVKLKTISAGGSKVVDAINSFDDQTLWEWDDPSTKKKPLVECGDIIRYKITFKNEETSTTSSSAIKKIDFLEEVPTGLNFISANPVDSTLTLSLTDYTSGGKTYKKCVLGNLTLKANESQSVYFYYKVNPSDKSKYIGMDQAKHYITNTVNLTDIYNKNNVAFAQNKTDTATVRLSRYQGEINKYLHIRKNGDINNGNDLEIKNAPKHPQDRSSLTEAQKTADPYYIEIGDEIVYRLVIKNTGEGGFSDIYFDDKYVPSELEYINTTIEVAGTTYGNTLADVTDNGSGVVTGHIPTTYAKPAEFSSTSVQRNSQYRHYTLAKDSTMILNIRFKVVKVQGDVENLSIFNTTDFIKIKNRNDWEYDFNKTSTEHVKEKIYNIWTDKYLIGYDKKMMNQNINERLITLDDENSDYYEGNVDTFLNARVGLTDEEREEKPFAVEKYETLTYKIRIVNKSTIDEVTEDTKMTVTSVIDHLSDGLEKINSSFKATISLNGTVSTYGLSVADLNSTGTSFEIKFNTLQKLAPQDYIDIEYQVKITSRNTNLDKLENRAVLSKLTNVNNVVIKAQTDENAISVNTRLNKQKTVTKEFMKLKELVIAGWVWNDINRNSLKEDSEVIKESGIGGLNVYLRNPNPIRIVGGTTEHSNKNTDDIGIYLNTTTLDDGLYTFGRIRRTKDDGSYKDDIYVEYIYDGIKYQSTLYTGKTNLDFDKMTFADNYKIDSNAKEYDEDRINFNDNLKTIYNNEGTSAFEGNPTADKDLIYNYNKKDYEPKPAVSKIVENEDNNMMHSYSFVNATHKSRELDPLFLGNLSLIDYETEYLKYINLGLIPRDKVDISIQENIEDITNTVFGDSMGYKLTDSKFEFYPADYYYKYTDYQNNAVNKTLTNTSELTSQVTYKAQVKTDFKNDNTLNLISAVHDSNVVVAVNELALYLDKKYTLETKDGEVSTIKIRKLNSNELYYTEYHDTVKAYYIDPSGNKIDLKIYTESKFQSSIAKITKESTNEYTALYIRPVNTGSEIILPHNGNTGTYVDIYLTFTETRRTKCHDLADTAFKNLCDDESTFELGRYNHTLEVNSFSTYYAGNASYVSGSTDSLEYAGKGAGYIDVDSNPGNVGFYKDDGNQLSNDIRENVTMKTGYAFGDNNYFDEDDTCRGYIDLSTKAIGQGLVREIKGTVFDDCRSETVGSGGDEQYVGDGIYNQSKGYNSNARTNSLMIDNNGKEIEKNDIPVPDVKVRLFKTIKVPVQSGAGAIDLNNTSTYNINYYEVDLSNTSQYSVPTEIDFGAHVESGNDGTYRLWGYTPGNYFVRFNYGDTPDSHSNFDNKVKFNGQDYKSTTLYPELRITDTDVIPYLTLEDEYKNSYQKGKEEASHYTSLRTYRNNILSYIESNEGSNALDDPQRRMETNLYATNINNAKSEVLNSGDNYLNGSYRNKSTNVNYKPLAEIFLSGTNMFADSVEFYSKAEDIAYIESNVRTDANVASTPYKANNTQYIEYPAQRENFDIEKVNFGIQYRPETELTLKEYIKEIRLDSQVGNGSQSKTIIDIYYTENREIDKASSNLGLDYLLRMKSTCTINGIKRLDTSVNKGFEYLNVDEKFLQGSTLYIIYGIYVDNTGENDRVNVKVLEPDGSRLTKTKLIDNIRKSISDFYKPKYSDNREYRKELKGWENYYIPYLGGVYYYKDKKTDNDTIATTKVDQFISDLDLEIDFDSQAHNNQWTYYEDIQDILDGGMYTIVQDYNVKGKNLNYKYSSDEQFINILREYLNVYSEMIEIYGEDAFYEFYTKLINSMYDNSALYTEQAVGNIITYYNRNLVPSSNDYKYVKRFFDQIGLDYHERHLKGTNYNTDHMKLAYLKAVEAITDTTIANYDKAKEVSKSNTQFYKEMYKILSLLNGNVRVYESPRPNRGSSMSSKSVIPIKKTVSVEIENPVQNTGYNTTYKFTKPDIKFAPKVSTIQYTDPSIFKNQNPRREATSRVGLELVTQKVISSDIFNSSGLSFDNVTEITNYTSSNGRRTVYNTVGNGTENEIDLDQTIEVVRLSVPTGLSIKEQKIEKAKYSVEIAIIIGLSILAGSGIIYNTKKIITKRKNKK